MRIEARIHDEDDRGKIDFDSERHIVLDLDTVPDVDDSIDVDGKPVIVNRRHWVSADHVRLLCRGSTAMWPYGNAWEAL